MSKHKEIDALNNTLIKHKIEIRFSATHFLTDKKYYREVELKLDEKKFNFFVEDEYNDIKYNYPLLNLCLILRELENYIESEDYLIWCKDRYIDPKNIKVLTHYKNLSTIYLEITKIIGKIDSQVSDWDFEMGSGAMWELRKMG